MLLLSGCAGLESVAVRPALPDASVMVAHPGTQHSLQAAAALAVGGLLDNFTTRIYYDRRRFPFSWLPDGAVGPIERGLWKRRHKDIPAERVRTIRSWEEVGLVLLSRAGLPHRLLTPLLAASQGRFARGAGAGLTPRTRAVVCYSLAALETFERAKSLDITCFLDMAQIHPSTSRRIFEEEARLAPEFASSIPFIYRSASAMERFRRELELADHVIVASEFARRSLLEQGVESARVSVAPYGVDGQVFHPGGEPRTCITKFRALFVGSIGQLKGIKYLLDAFRSWAPPDAELVLCGKMLLGRELRERYSGVFRHVEYRSHMALSELYRSADVVVFPSLADSFGLVVLEAMACGVPVIASANTCALDTIEDGSDGFIVPIRDSGALVDRLDRLYRDRGLARTMGRAARQKALRFSWSRYGECLRAIVRRHAGRREGAF